MKKVKNKKVKKSKNKKINVASLIITVIFTILTGLLIFNLVKLANIETVLRIVVIVILGLILGLLVVFQKKKRVLCNVLMIILCLLYVFLNYTFYRVYASLDNITKKVDTKGICLVASSAGLDSIDDLGDDDIAIVGKTMDEAFYEMALEIIEAENLNNELVEYDDYFGIINALLNDEIKYAFLPENYNAIYSANSGEGETKELQFSVLYTKQKLIESNNEIASAKSLDEPFAVLLMGSDVLLDSYNADTLMVLTVNPKTMKVTMLSIPRDTYTTIACTGGKHKINSSGWYGDSCVVRTVEKYLDIDIDYYAKINFLGIVDLVNVLGGIEVDVPYAFCEQNSKREWGNSTVFVDAGMQTLDGEQALALSRNRHYWTGICPAKYTSDGNRSDFTRGANQQLVIKSILSKLMTVRDINTFYKILDTIGNNMTTNMSRDTILSLYNVGKNVVKRLNTSDANDVINIERLSFRSYITSIHLSGLDLSMVVNYDESVNYISKQMKKNLGLVKEEVIKEFSFDIAEEYDADSVSYNKLTSNLSLLSNLVGKTLGDAISYCNKTGITCDSSSNDMNAVVVSQSIAAKTDLATMRNKTVILGVESVSNIGTDSNNTPTDDKNNTGTDIDNGSNGDNSETDNNGDDNSGSDDGTTGDNGENNDGGTTGDNGENNNGGNNGDGSSDDNSSGAGSDSGNNEEDKKDDNKEEGDVSGEN